MLQAESLRERVYNPLLSDTEIRAERSLVCGAVCHEHDQLRVHIECPWIGVVDFDGRFLLLGEEIGVGGRVVRKVSRRRWRIGMRRLIKDVLLPRVLIHGSAMDGFVWSIWRRVS